MPYVALLAEGVDRNDFGLVQTALDEWSPSSRRAWIEMAMLPPRSLFMPVALLAEGVDRNCPHHNVLEFGQVALLAEGVDRNSHTS